MSTIALTDLPEPDAEAQAHSQQLQIKIKQKIAEQGGAISFADFMQMALYEPGLGYYSAGLQKFGAQGDFITAPEISPLFSQAIANQCVEILKNLSSSNILEFGAGSGTMAAAILLRLEQLQQLPEYYYILEVSADLRQRQQQTIQTYCAHLLERVIWLEQLPTEPITAVVLANEVLDAMPVQRYRKIANGFVQAFVVCHGQQLSIEYRPVNLVEAFPDLAENYEFEVCEYLAPWLQSLADFIIEGVVILIDYGSGAREYFDPARRHGSLRCFYRHRMHNEPLFWPGLQDITANVNFTAVAEAAYAAGFDILGYSTQATFLLGNHILQLAETDDAKLQFNQQQQLKQLLLPTEMGELFKVLVVSKNYQAPLQGLTINLLKKL